MQLHHLGQVGRFPHSVHTTKSDDERSPLALSLHHISEDIHPPLWLQDLHQRVLQGLLYRGGHSYKHTILERNHIITEGTRTGVDCTQCGEKVVIGLESQLTGEGAHNFALQFFGYGVTELGGYISCYILG